jgi:hypothetical protein
MSSTVRTGDAQAGTSNFGSVVPPHLASRFFQKPLHKANHLTIGVWRRRPGPPSLAGVEPGQSQKDKLPEMSRKVETNTGLTPGQQRLNDLWDEHLRDEFATRDTNATLDTMVPDANVNHVPVLTGGVGREQLREFYSRHFIPKMPADTEIVPISRTIGTDRLVDEMIFRFYPHTRNGLDATRYCSHWKTGRVRLGCHRAVPGRKTRP